MATRTATRITELETRQAALKAQLASFADAGLQSHSEIGLSITRTDFAALTQELRVIEADLSMLRCLAASGGRSVAMR